MVTVLSAVQPAVATPQVGSPSHWATPSHVRSGTVKSVTRLRLGVDVSLTVTKLSPRFVTHDVFTTTFNPTSPGAMAIGAGSGGFIVCRVKILRGPGEVSARRNTDTLGNGEINPQTGELTPDTDCGPATHGVNRKSRIMLTFRNMETGKKAALKVPARYMPR